ncbi:MAG: cysteine methyltransferase [Gammaproteobacteria bacterium]|nr:cysteine methyltransferase [Gammaproteobacteria bacterium]
MKAVAEIPKGRVCPYGRVAEVAGLPGRARLVGRLLGELTGRDELPWHRVLRADGSLAFPAGSRGFERQVAKLAEEGVNAATGRVDLVRFGWQTSLDEQLWGPD